METDIALNQGFYSTKPKLLIHSFETVIAGLLLHSFETVIAG